MSVRILGIDPGSRFTGIGIIDIEGQRNIHVHNTCLKIPQGELADRLDFIFAGITELIEEFQPQEISIEQVFMHKNPDSALKLGQARGVAIVACARASLPVYEYSATQVKKSVVGRGHAAKDQVQHMVKVLLNISTPLQEDAADGLAIALCHGHTRESLLRMPDISGVKGGRFR